MSFALFYLTFIVFYWVLSGFISFYRVLSAFTGCYWVLLGFTEFRFIDYFHCQWFGKARTSRVLFLFPFFFFAISIEAVTSRYFHTVSKKQQLGEQKKKLISYRLARQWVVFVLRLRPSSFFFFFDYLAAPVRTKLEARGGVLRSSPLRRHGNRVAGAKPTKKKKKAEEKKRKEKKTGIIDRIFPYYSHYATEKEAGRCLERHGCRTRFEKPGETRLKNQKKNKPEGDPRRGAGGGRYRLAGEDLRRPANRRPRKKGRPKNRGTPTKRSFFLAFLNETS